MPEADFYGNEVSWTSESDTTLSIILIADDGSHTVLADGIQVERNEIVDTTFLSVCRLQAFLKESLAEAKRKSLVWTIHLKATMMKRSDPVIFGHAVRVFFDEVFTKYGDTLKDAGANPNNGLQDILSAVEAYPINLALREHKAALQTVGFGLEESPNLSVDDLQNAIEEIKHAETKERLRETVNSAVAARDEILEAIQKAIENGPSLGMVDSKKGITNLHSPAGTIIDASMPRLLCNAGWWDADDEVRPALAVIPDRTFADLYQGNLADLKKNNAFLPAKMGSVTTVRLTAYKAEEYGSHETTYEIEESGTVIVIDGNAKLLSSHRVQAGDVWRMCRVKEAAYKDWVSLAVKTASETGDPTVFWLDENRPHDEQLAVKVREYLNELDVSGLNIEIMHPLDAVAFTNARIRKGFNVTCVVGNVRGDHNTDIYPIFELGTSAAMESLLYLVTGGIVCETGSAGTCPDHVKQLLEENYLRWDSMGEFLAMVAALAHLSNVYDHSKALVMSQALERAIELILTNDKSPARKLGELDNRGSHFYLALYWAQELAAQDEDGELKSVFANAASKLAEAEAKIIETLTSVQNQAVDLGGYFYPNQEKVDAVMWPSSEFDGIISDIPSAITS